MPSDDDGVLAEAVEVVAIAEVGPLLADGRGPFTDAELAYARDKSDPERRLAARLAAKRAAARLLGVGEADVEVGRASGRPPWLRLSPRADEQLRRMGARALLVSLTHGRDYAAAAVVMLGEPA